MLKLKTAVVETSKFSQRNCWTSETPSPTRTVQLPVSSGCDSKPRGWVWRLKMLSLTATDSDTFRAYAISLSASVSLHYKTLASESAAVQGTGRARVVPVLILNQHVGDKNLSRIWRVKKGVSWFLGMLLFLVMIASNFSLFRFVLSFFSFDGIYLTSRWKVSASQEMFINVCQWRWTPIRRRDCEFLIRNITFFAEQLQNKFKVKHN